LPELSGEILKPKEKKIELSAWESDLPQFSLGIPDESKAPMVTQMLGTFWMSTILAFATRAGTEESMQVLGPVIENIGRSKAESMMRVLPPFEKNALGFARWTNGWEELMGIEGEITEASPERVVKVITKCPVLEMEGASPIMCDLFECSLKGSSAIIAPGFMFHQTHNPLRGAKYCRWVIERIKE
jgi:hypothetical protein